MNAREMELTIENLRRSHRFINQMAMTTFGLYNKLIHMLEAGEVEQTIALIKHLRGILEERVINK